MVLCACRCLNVKVHLQVPLDIQTGASYRCQAAVPAESSGSGDGRAGSFVFNAVAGSLTLAGTIVEIGRLTRITSNVRVVAADGQDFGSPSVWRLLSCINCDFPVLVFGGQSIPSAVTQLDLGSEAGELIGPNDLLLVNSGILLEGQIEAIAQSKEYSEAFRLCIYSERPVAANPSLSAGTNEEKVAASANFAIFSEKSKVDERHHPYLAHLQSVVVHAISQRQKEYDSRIAAFIANEQAALDHFRLRAFSDRDALWSSLMARIGISDSTPAADEDAYPHKRRATMAPSAVYSSATSMASMTSMVAAAAAAASSVTVSAAELDRARRLEGSNVRSSLIFSQDIPAGALVDPNHVMNRHSFSFSTNASYLSDRATAAATAAAAAAGAQGADRVRMQSYQKMLESLRSTGLRAASNVEIPDLAPVQVNTAALVDSVSNLPNQPHAYELDNDDATVLQSGAEHYVQGMDMDEEGVTARNPTDQDDIFGMDDIDGSRKEEPKTDAVPFGFSDARPRRHTTAYDFSIRRRVNGSQAELLDVPGNQNFVFRPSAAVLEGHQRMSSADEPMGLFGGASMNGVGMHTEMGVRNDVDEESARDSHGVQIPGLDLRGHQQESSSNQLYSQSLPIAIPLPHMTARPRPDTTILPHKEVVTAIHEEDIHDASLEENEDSFIAPHELIARTFKEESLATLGTHPFQQQRKQSVLF